MHINSNLSLQAPAKPRWQQQHANKHKLVITLAPAKPRWQQQRAQLIQAPAKPRWQEQRAQQNSSICKTLMAGTACK